MIKEINEVPHRRGGFLLMWQQPVKTYAVGCSSRADAVINFIAAYSAAETPNDFQWTSDNPKNCPIPFRQALGTGVEHTLV